MLRRFGSVLVLLAVLAPVAQARPTLKRFKGCPQLVGYAQRHADGYQAGGPPGQFEPAFTRTPVFVNGVAEDSAGSAPLPTSAPAASGGDEAVSLTNNQEAGVFEPDTVKTDGRYVYTIAGGVLHIVDASGTPTEVGSLTLENAGYSDQLLLFHGRLLVAGPAFNGDGTLLRLIDVSDPAKPVEIQRLLVDGQLLAERRTGATVRVVLTSIPRAIAQPDTVEPDRPVAWTPRGTFLRVRSEKLTTRRLVPCDQVRRPKTFTGLESLTVLTIDMDKGLNPVDSDVVMTSGETVYASATNLYVTTHRYEPRLEARTDGPVPENEATQLHRFSLDNAQETTYRASGAVPGFVLNQFSLSENADVLRVATTTTPPWFTQGESESAVTTFGQDLKPLGSVGGLGKSERIYAVRFLGDTGYVVTFRQTDPLYTVDLSDPASPRVRGELKIDGFSSYLHPIANDRLIGVGTGPAEDESGSGLQLSLFDVSDLDNPKLEKRVTYAGGSSDAQYDHHAFLWWAPRDLMVLPVSQYQYNDVGGPQPIPATSTAGSPRVTPIRPSGFQGAIGFTVKPGTLAEAGRYDKGPVQRTLVLGDKLVMVGYDGVHAVSIDDYSDRGGVDFPNPYGGGPISVDAASATPPRP